MAETTTASKTATKKATAKKATAKKATAKKASTTATAARKTTAKKTTAKKATAKKATSRGPRTPRLLEREPRVLLRDAGYVAAGVVHDAVERARALPERLEDWRGEAEKAAKDAPERVQELRTEVPSRVETTVKDVRVRVGKDLQSLLDGFEKRFDGKAADGRKVAESWRSDQRVQRVLDQTGNTRSQVKGAVTSIVKTGEVATEAGREQAGTAATQVKAAATSVRKSAETVAEATTER